jgi:putative endonuclease
LRIEILSFSVEDWIPHVYILASCRNGTLYTGVTTNLLRRVWEHREGMIPGFTSRYGVKRLVWYEEQGDIVSAIAREKQIKRWRRAWKLALIETRNPQWLDLWDVLHAPPTLPQISVIPGRSEPRP